MKHLKTYENNTKYKYWTCHREENYLRKELEKLKCPEKKINDIIEESKYLEEDFVFVGKKRNIFIISPSGYDLVRQGYVGQGGVKLTTDEIDDIKTTINSKKYNL